MFWQILVIFPGKDLLVWPTIPGPEYDTSSSQIFTAKTFQTKFQIVLLWSSLLHLSLKQIQYLVVQSFTLVYFKDNMTCFQRFTHLFKWHKYQSQTRGWQNPRMWSRVRLGQSRLDNTFNENYMNSANVTSLVAVADQGMAKPEDLVQGQVRLVQVRQYF